MKLPDTEQFTFKEGIIGGDECILIGPNDIKCKWTEDTLQFRSMIIRKSDHKVINRGFSKFFNFSEQPDLNKFPDGPFTAIEKKDGSLICWGIHNEEIIHRTRATFNLEGMANGHELEFLKSKYPLLQVAIKWNPQYSILTEWETPTNFIVIHDVKEPTLTLVGVINNETGILCSQDELDERAIAWGLPRPTKYHYESISDLIKDVELWEGKEGVVIYSDDGQKLRKIKSEWYRVLHSMFSGMKTIGNVLDIYLQSPRYSDPKDFYNYLEKTMDHEIAEICKDHIEDICRAYQGYCSAMVLMRTHVHNWKKLETRRDQALAIVDFSERFCFANPWVKPLAFILLDDKEVDDKLLRKILENLIELDDN